MKIKYSIIILLTILVIKFNESTAQTLTQTVSGKVIEKNTQEPLFGANVTIQTNNNILGTSTDSNGKFKIENVPIGRHNLSVSMLGFSPFIANNILVNSGKEVFLEIEMEEMVNIISEVVISAKVDKDQAINKMATVSARMLSSEEANRYAGSWGDPARMASSFAGVIASNDSRNDIIIRGNSPMGLLWKLDGFEIPNPNHFGAMGGTGGPVSMLNNNQLTNSDFYTGAFPAEFGNATSGVFDLRLRNGNNRKHEFMTSIGFNGFELGAEGPLVKGKEASYMVNGRYSFLKALDLVGFKIAGAGGAIPEYQDITAKINVPLKKGNLSLVSLLGSSKIHMKPDMSEDSESNWQNGDFGTEILEKNQQYFTGINYTARLKHNTRLENRLSYQLFKSNMHLYSHSFPDAIKADYFNGIAYESRIAYSSSIHNRINSRNFILGGIGIDFFNTGFDEAFYGYNNIPEYMKNDDNSTLVKAYTQWQHKFSDNISITPGIYSQYFLLNNDFAIEPRLGFKWTITKNSSINIGTGLHSQLAPRRVYFYNLNNEFPNKNLKFSKSWQSVLGYDYKMSDDIRFKVETYYQYLFDIPVIPDIPEQSILNIGDDYYNPWDFIFVNKGTGKNYGIEVTIEKFFNKNYYFLLTGSIYDSKYCGYDGIKRNTKFAGNFTVNALGGYEWKIGKTNLLSINLKLSYLGNKRILPTTIPNTGADAIYDYAHTYEKRLPNYFRCDINVSMKNNYNKVAVEWFFEFDNITNHKNIWGQVYNTSRQEYEYTYQTGFMPMGGCKVYF